MKEEHVLSVDNGFLANIYLVSFVNVLGAILALSLNPLVIYGSCRNKELNKITRTLTILLGLVGLCGALFIQSLYATSKFIVIANIHSPENFDKSNYCIVILIVAYGTKAIGGLSIVTMLGITAERYTAVVSPFYYRTTRRVFLKTLPSILVVLFIHFSLSDIWSWYQSFAKVVNAIFIIIPYVFTIYAYGKIYFKLGKLRGANTTVKKQSIISFLIVVTYLICYLPLIIIRSFNLDKNNLLVQLYLRPWCNTLLFCSFSLNAVVYGWSSIRGFMPIISKQS
jgi:hypothetical protein